MLDRDKIEKSLLLGIVHSKKWEVLLENSITRDCFSNANLRLYDYIYGFAQNGNYPDIRILTNYFEIEDIMVREYLTVSDSLDELCNVLHNEYVKNQLKYKVGQLNEHQNELFENPTKYVDRMATMVDEMQKISYQTKAVDLFENIESQVNIDKDDVIGTGFKELDNKLIGWKRGEELVVFVGRTGQGKSWLCLKFAMAAALAGEKVGIYSGEMSQQQLQERMICCAKQSPTSSMEEAIQFIKEHEIKISLITQRELRGRATIRDIEEFIIRNNLTIVIIDQLSLMEDTTCKPRNTIKTNIW